MAAKGDAVTPKTEEETAGGDGEKANSPLLLSKDAPEATSNKELDDGVPYDRGWAWVVVFGCFVNFIILSGYLKSGGVIFVELLRQFQAPVTQTALLFGIRAGVFSISAMYVMNVVASRLGARKTVLIGATVIPLSAIMASLANSLTTLICVQATLTGLGMATLISPGEVLLGAYFKRRRSLAFALAKCGASIGSMAIPPLVNFLLEHYGLKGALLLTGALCLHAWPASLLLRPTSYFKKQRRYQHEAAIQAPPPETSLKGRTFNIGTPVKMTEINGVVAKEQSLNDQKLLECSEDHICVEEGRNGERKSFMLVTSKNVVRSNCDEIVKPGISPNAGNTLLAKRHDGVPNGVHDLSNGVACNDVTCKSNQDNMNKAGTKNVSSKNEESEGQSSNLEGKQKESEGQSSNLEGKQKEREDVTMTDAELQSDIEGGKHSLAETESKQKLNLGADFERDKTGKKSQADCGEPLTRQASGPISLHYSDSSQHTLGNHTLTRQASGPVSLDYSDSSQHTLENHTTRTADILSCQVAKGESVKSGDFRPNLSVTNSDNLDTHVLRNEHAMSSNQLRGIQFFKPSILSPTSMESFVLHDIIPEHKKEVHSKLHLPKLHRAISEQTTRTRCYSDHWVETVSRTDPLDTLSRSVLVKGLSTSTFDFGSMVLISQTCLDDEQKKRSCDANRNDIQSKPFTRNMGQVLFKCIKACVSMLDFSLLKHPLFRLLLLYFVFSPMVNVTVDYLPAIATENGVSETQAALLLSIIGGLDFFCRLISGVIADLRKVRVSTMIIFSFAILGVSSQLVRFVTSFPLFLVFAVLHGMLGGVGNCLTSILIIEFVGLENMGKAIGFSQLVSGASMAAFFPLLGYIRDISGSYIVVCHVIGCGVLIAAGLLCCEGTVRRLSASSARRESDTMSVHELIILRSEEPAVEQAAADRREHFQRRRAVSVGAEDVFTKYLTPSCDNRR